MIDPRLDAVARVLELAEGLAENADRGERREATAERDALRIASRYIAEAAQYIANAEEAHARGQVRQPRAASAQLYALLETAKHLKRITEAHIAGPVEIGGAVARPINLAQIPDAQLADIAEWLEEHGNTAHGSIVNYYVAAACVRQMLTERVLQREEGGS